MRSLAVGHLGVPKHDLARVSGLMHDAAALPRGGRGASAILRIPEYHWDSVGRQIRMGGLWLGIFTWRSSHYHARTADANRGGDETVEKERDDFEVLGELCSSSNCVLSVHNLGA